MNKYKFAEKLIKELSEQERETIIELISQIILLFNSSAETTTYKEITSRIGTKICRDITKDVQSTYNIKDTDEITYLDCHTELKNEEYPDGLLIQLRIISTDVLKEKHDGEAFYRQMTGGESYGVIILSPNKNTNTEVDLFIIAHELAHIVINRLEFNIRSETQFDALEMVADYFGMKVFNKLSTLNCIEKELVSEVMIEYIVGSENYIKDKDYQERQEFINTIANK